MKIADRTTTFRTIAIAIKIILIKKSESVLPKPKIFFIFLNRFNMISNKWNAFASNYSCIVAQFNILICECFLSFFSDLYIFDYRI